MLKVKVDASHTLPSWLNMHRDLCIDWAALHMQQPVGGPGHCVQIDKTMIAWPK